MNIALARNAITAEPSQGHTSELLAFFSEYQDAIRNAAWLLGGREANQLVDKISDAISHELEPSQRTIKLLRDLENLLALEHVGDPDRPESGFFSCVDIMDPIVEEICLLTDGLRNAISAVTAVSDLPTPELSRHHIGLASRHHGPAVSTTTSSFNNDGEVQ